MTHLTQSILDAVAEVWQGEALEPKLMATRLLSKQDRSFKIGRHIYFGFDFQDRVKRDYLAVKRVRHDVYRSSFDGVQVYDADEIGFAKKGRQFTAYEIQVNRDLMGLLSGVHRDNPVQVWRAFSKDFKDMETDTAKIYGGVFGDLFPDEPKFSWELGGGIGDQRK